MTRQKRQNENKVSAQNPSEGLSLYRSATKPNFAATNSSKHTFTKVIKLHDQFHAKAWESEFKKVWSY